MSPVSSGCSLNKKQKFNERKVKIFKTNNSHVLRWNDPWKSSSSAMSTYVLAKYDNERKEIFFFFL